ncbi:MAG: hypothetical protein ABJK37_22740 [Paraglaciecola sp.]|uniref:hypothetical protein n=1 Tax=Paraglaciecola sp. TaxID=1920173 RepID=UPI00329764AA
MNNQAECFGFLKSGEQGIVYSGMYANFSDKLAKLTETKPNRKSVLQWQSPYRGINLELTRLLQKLCLAKNGQKVQLINQFNMIASAILDFSEIQTYCELFNQKTNISLKSFLKTDKRIFNIGFNVLNQNSPSAERELVFNTYNKTLNTLSRSIWPPLPVSTITRGKIREGTSLALEDDIKSDFTEPRFVPTETDNCTLNIAQSAYFRHLLNVRSEGHSIDLGQYLPESRQLNVVHYTDLRIPFLCVLSLNGKKIPFIANVDNEDILENTMEFLNLSAEVDAYINLNDNWQFCFQ